MTPERMHYMRRNGWLPREPVRTDPRPALDVMTPWLPPWKPEEGPIEGDGLDKLTLAFAALGEHRDDITAIAHQANQAGYPISLKQLCSERRYYIAKGLITLFRACADAPLPATTATQVDDLARRSATSPRRSSRAGWPSCSPWAGACTCPKIPILRRSSWRTTTRSPPDPTKPPLPRREQQ
jgi:hypothetical protein